MSKAIKKLNEQLEKAGIDLVAISPKQATRENAKLRIDLAKARELCVHNEDIYKADLAAAEQKLTDANIKWAIEVKKVLADLKRYKEILEEIEAVACGEKQIQADGVYDDSDGLKWIYDRIQALNPKETNYEPNLHTIRHRRMAGTGAAASRKRQRYDGGRCP